MPRFLLIAGLLVIFIGLPLKSDAKPRGNVLVTSIYRNDGNSASLFAVTCTSSAWTVVGSSQTYVGAQLGSSRLRRRAMTVQTLATVTYAVCLSSTSVAGDTCVDGRPGYELGSAWGSVSIYDEALWYCRTRTDGSTSIKAVEHYDSRDEEK